MRPIESVLLVANLLAFGVLTIPLLRTLQSVGTLGVITVLIAGIQIVGEGQRWQMIPAYMLAGALSAIWLLQSAASVRGVMGQLQTNPVVSGLAIGAGLLGLVVSAALPMLFPVFQFPQPSGVYPIGTVTYHWVDAQRHEVFSADAASHRELMVQVWYPAKDDPTAPRAPYMPEADGVAPTLARIFHMPPFFFGHFKYVTTHAAASAPVASEQASYPVLIFLTGLNGFRQSNMFQVEELVSHGYIVAAIDQPYAAAAVVFPDGRQINGWTRDQMQPLIQQSLEPAEDAPTINGEAMAKGILPYFAEDMRFTLDQLTVLNSADPHGILTGRLDMQRVGVFGISLGAMVAAEACHADARLHACLMMDAAMPADVVRDGLQQPSIWFTRDADSMRLERQKAGGWTEADITQTLTTMRTVFEMSWPSAGYYVQVPGMFHVNYTDAPRFSPITPLLGFAGPLDAQRSFDIINAYSLAFFDQHLVGRPQLLLEGASAQYPEAIFESRQTNFPAR